jgi:hypothetical protein
MTMTEKKHQSTKRPQNPIGWVALRVFNENYDLFSLNCVVISWEDEEVSGGKLPKKENQKMVKSDRKNYFPSSPFKF